MRNLYGCTTADFTLTEGGRVVAGAVLTVWSARVGGTQITDLTDIDGAPVTVVTSDSQGRIGYYGPDGSKATHWLDAGEGDRVGVRPVDLTGESAYEVAVADGFEGTEEEWLESLTGDTGATGPTGATGAKGDKGDTGLTGPAPTLATGTITPSTLNAGEAVTASLTVVELSAGAYRLDGTFGIPQGAPGALGAYQAKTAAYTILGTDGTVAVDTTSGAVTLTLPGAAANSGKWLRIIKTAGANTLTISRAGSDTILPSSGTRTQVAFPSGATPGWVTLVSTGTAWYVDTGRASDETVGRRIWEWEQAQAAGSTTAAVGWQMVYGDTGWRDLSAALTNGWTGTVQIRRCVDLVEYDISALTASAATTGVPFTFASGWRIGAPSALHRGLVYTTGLTFRRTATDKSGGAYTITGYQAADVLYGSGSGTTLDAWPTSLPGTAA